MFISDCYFTAYPFTCKTTEEISCRSELSFGALSINTSFEDKQVEDCRKGCHLPSGDLGNYNLLLRINASYAGKVRHGIL